MLFDVAGDHLDDYTTLTEGGIDGTTVANTGWATDLVAHDV
jgi:hypothetical protein